MTSFGELMRSVRQTAGITQEQLARELNITLRTASRYENELPPNATGVIKIIHWAEDRGLKAEAEALRDFYVQMSYRTAVALMETSRR